MPVPIPALAPIYVSVVEHCRYQARTVEEVRAYASAEGVSVGASAVYKTLAAWADAGALRRLKVPSGGMPRHAYRATSRALEPTVMVSALGMFGAQRAAAKLGPEVAAALVPVAGPARPALVAEPMPEPPSVPPSQGAAGAMSLFGAQATFEGLLIPWDQVPRLAELMSILQQEAAR